MLSLACRVVKSGTLKIFIIDKSLYKAANEKLLTMKYRSQ